MEAGIKQGYILSPTLSNIFMINFDNNIGKYCEDNGIKFSRYCDDMLFSSPSQRFDMDEIKEKVKEELSKTDNELNCDKTEYKHDNINFLGLNIGWGRVKLSRRKTKLFNKLKVKKSPSNRELGKLSYFNDIEARAKNFKEMNND